MKNILPMKKGSAGILVGKENVVSYLVALWASVPKKSK